jgi:hypothetical protein
MALYCSGADLFRGHKTRGAVKNISQQINAKIILEFPKYFVYDRYLTTRIAL